MSTCADLRSTLIPTKRGPMASDTDGHPAPAVEVAIPSDGYPLNFVELDLVAAPIVEPCRSR